MIGEGVAPSFFFFFLNNFWLSGTPVGGGDGKVVAEDVVSQRCFPGCVGLQQVKGSESSQ